MLTSKPAATILTLPAEVRRAIYAHLFCFQELPIWIGTRYVSLKGLSESEPVFHTALLRTCKEIHDEAVGFAYSQNDFTIKDSFAAFCGLSPLALASIRGLTVIHTSWTAEVEYEDQAWDVIRSQCCNLRLLELDLHGDLLLQAIPFLEDFFNMIESSGRRPNVVLDLYVWAKHFSFDPIMREHARFTSMLNGQHEQSPWAPKFAEPRTRMLRLPPSAENIVFSSDVTQGAIDALDRYFAQSKQVRLRKVSKDLPKTGRRANGRSSRFCYVWDGSFAEAIVGKGQPVGESTEE